MEFLNYDDIGYEGDVEDSTMPDDFEELTRSPQRRPHLGLLPSTLYPWKSPTMTCPCDVMNVVEWLRCPGDIFQKRHYPVEFADLSLMRWGNALNESCLSSAYDDSLPEVIVNVSETHNLDLTGVLAGSEYNIETYPVEGGEPSTKRQRSD